MHSYSHNYEYLYPGRSADAAHVACDYQWGEWAIQEVLGTGYDGDVSRYPGGHMSWRHMTPADQALAKLGDTWIDWNSMSGDAEPASDRPTTVSGMVRMVDKDFSGFGGGNVIVVLDHDADDKRLTVRAMPQIIAHLKKLGFTFGVIA